MLKPISALLLPLCSLCYVVNPGSCLASLQVGAAEGRHCDSCNAALQWQQGLPSACAHTH